MASRLLTTSLPSPPSVTPSVTLQLLPLLLCLCCCVRLAAPLRDANWPQLSIQQVFNVTGLSSEQDFLLRETIRVAASRLESLLRGLYLKNCATIDPWKRGDDHPSTISVVDLNPGQAIRLNRSRSYCSQWLAEDRCGLLNESYRSTDEVCTSDTTFQIPQEYLSEVAVYNSSKLVVDRGGSGGEAGANFILFVATQQSRFCSAADPRQVAGTACSQQWMVWRPLAGLLRVCPQLINAELTSRSGQLLQQILAGLVRMLAFSEELMPNFQRLRRLPSDIDAGDEWETLQEHDIIILQNGVAFVRTPLVHRFAERHFNCSIGLPLAPSADAWDPVFMFPSALSSVPISPGVSGLDEGTLALLEDSGWYTVNSSLVDRFSWGHQAGCWFSTSCSTPEPFQSSSMFCSTDQEPSPALKPDHSHRSVGSCEIIAGTNCSTVLPRNAGLCNLSGNWRSLELLSQNRRWTECLSVTFPTPSDLDNGYYVVTRNDVEVICLSNFSNARSAQVKFGDDDIQLSCVNISLICPRQSSVLDLLSGFSWLRTTGAFDNGSTIVNASSTVSGSASSAEKASRGTTDVGTSRSVSKTRSFTSTSASIAVTTGARIWTTVPTIAVSSTETTPIIQAHSMRQTDHPMKKSRQTTPFERNYPAVKFSIRFETMDYFQLVKKALVQEFKVMLQKVLAKAFRISIDQMSVLNVKPGSVIAIWENSDPSTDANSKLQLIQTKVGSGDIVVSIDGVEYSATSVEYHTEENDAKDFPLMEVVIGSVVGALLLIGLVLVIVLVTMKHKINRPRMQVRPRSVDTTPTTSSQTSRQCSAATSGVVQLATLGSAGVAPSAGAVADVESTLDGGRRSNGGRGGRGRGAIIGERGASAGSVGLQFSDSQLYFEI